MLRIAVCLFLAATAFAGPGVDLSLSADELQRYFGVNSHEKAPEYEIVYPEVVTTDSKRNVGRDAIAYSSLELQIDAFGQTLELSVEHDDSSIKPGLVAEYDTDQGIITVPVRTDCLYTGKVRGQSKSLASVSACAGLMAVIYHTDGPTYIEPLDDEHAIKRDIGRGLPHIAYKRMPYNGATCPVTSDSRFVNTDDDDDNKHMKDDISPQATQNIELAFIGDSLVYDIRGSNTHNCLTTLFNAVKNVLQLNSLDASNTLVPKLVHIKVFTSAETGLKTCQDSDTSVERAAAWQNANNPAKPSASHWDNAVIMTGWEMDSGGTLGIAYIGQCDNYYSASVSTFRSLDATDTVAHEIGHNLDMQHDSKGNSCSSSGYVMAAVSGDHRAEPGWSTCSKSYYDSFVGRKSCYDD